MYPFLPFPFIILTNLLFDVLPFAQDSSGVAVTLGGEISDGGGDVGTSGGLSKVTGAGIEVHNWTLWIMESSVIVMMICRQKKLPMGCRPAFL